MSENTVAHTITRLAEPLAASLGLCVWGLELAFGGRSLVRLYVEGEEGVDLDACAELSRLLSLSLDVEDIMPGAYVLEVSSPGIERTFFTPEQLSRYTGKVVEVSLRAPAKEYPGRKKLLGTLTRERDGVFFLRPPEGDGAEFSFAFQDAKTIRLVHLPPEEAKVKGKTTGRTRTSKAPKRAAKAGTAAERHSPDSGAKSGTDSGGAPL